MISILIYLSLVHPVLHTQVVLLTSIPRLAHIVSEMAQADKSLETKNAIEWSPDLAKSYEDEKGASLEATALELPSVAVGRNAYVSSAVTVLISGVALFSDGYNAQIIGFMHPLFAELYDSLLPLRCRAYS